MSKRIIHITSFLFCMLSFSSCSFFGEDLYPSNRCYWIVKNTSDSQIIVCSELSLGSKEKTLNPGESYFFIEIDLTKGHAVYFGRMYDYNAVNDTVGIRNADNTKTLKIWRESEKDNQGRQFFNEEYWTKREWKEDGSDHHEWTFELLQEDIE